VQLFARKSVDQLVTDGTATHSQLGVSVGDATGDVLGAQLQSVEPGSPAADAGLTPNLQAHIGRHVRAVFDEVAREPIPEHLLRLLSDLERSGDK